MEFSRIHPPAELRKLVECYWIARSSNTTPILQKIIPDGFPELIFHFGDPYRIKLTDTWEQQANNLLAGQITKFFFLENSGNSDILGIKLAPAAVTHLFGTNMSALCDRVVSLEEVDHPWLLKIHALIREANTHESRIQIFNQQLIDLQSQLSEDDPLEQAIKIIHESHGVIAVAALCQQCGFSERQAERLFKRCIGLPPKFYARVVRFSHIFQVAQEKQLSWSEVGLESGFYDQAHFIKDFKAFAGEDPSRYFFDEPTLANFFMKKV
jgi:AraC-like DNA-binding protein